MMAALTAQAAPWLAAGLALLVVFAAASVLGARSLFTASVAIAALCACAAGTLLALGQGEGALALALLGGGVAPALLLGGALLSNRAVQPRRGRPWLSVFAAAAAAAAMLWAAPSTGGGEPISASRGGAPLALAAIIFVAVAACAALLGYGERGVLSRRSRDA